MVFWEVQRRVRLRYETVLSRGTRIRGGSRFVPLSIVLGLWRNRGLSACYVLDIGVFVKQEALDADRPFRP